MASSMAASQHLSQAAVLRQKEAVGSHGCRRSGSTVTCAQQQKSQRTSVNNGVSVGSLLQSASPSKLWWRNLFDLPTSEPSSYANVTSESMRNRGVVSASYLMTSSGGSGGKSVAPTREKDSKIRELDWRPVRMDAEKARLLRKKMREHENWHDTMYHSGIATRLAQS